MSTALQMFVTQTVAKGAIPFIIEADEKAKHKAFVLRELAESKEEALNPDNIIDGHDDFMHKWEQRRKARQDALQD